jgi:ketosteroid isomerase-like protein
MPCSAGPCAGRHPESRNLDAIEDRSHLQNFRRRAVEQERVTRQVTSNDERGARLARAITATIAGDTAQLRGLFTDDVVASGPAIRATSRAELASQVERRVAAFSDRKVTVAPLDVAGAQACVEWVASGVHSGPLAMETASSPAGVIAPTGRRVRIRAISVAEFEGDQICSFRSYWDTGALLDDLGANTGS